MTHPLDEAYEQILDPINFVKNFADMEAFVEWAREGSIQDLQEAVKVFESAELYEYCVVMQALIFKKLNV